MKTSNVNILVSLVVVAGLAAVLAVPARASLVFYHTFDSVPETISDESDLDADFGVVDNAAVGKYGNVANLNRVSGQPGFGYALEASDVAAATYNVSNLHTTTGTLEMWWKPSADFTTDSGDAYFISQLDSADRRVEDGASRGAWGFLFRDDDQGLRLWARDSEGNKLQHDLAVTVSSLDSNTWYHIAFTYDGTDAQVFFNGVGSTVASGVALPIGTAAGGATYFGIGSDLLMYGAQGTIDSIGIYNTVEYSGTTYTVPTSQVPEPTTLCLLIVAGGGLALLRRRR